MDRQTSQKIAFFSLAARLVVGLILIISGVMKAAAPPEEFAVVIESYRLLGSADATLTLATFLPWLEVVLGFCLLFGFMTAAAAAAAGSLFVVFIAALLSTFLRGIHLPSCGCFGFGWHPSPLQTILLDSLLAACSFLAFRAGDRLLSLDNWRRSGYTESRKERHA